MICVSCEKVEAREHGYPLCSECETDRQRKWSELESLTRVVVENRPAADAIRETLPAYADWMEADSPVQIGGFEWHATARGWETHAENALHRLSRAYGEDFRPELIRA